MLVRWACYGTDSPPTLSLRTPAVPPPGPSVTPRPASKQPSSTPSPRAPFVSSFSPGTLWTGQPYNHLFLPPTPSPPPPSPPLKPHPHADPLRSDPRGHTRHSLRLYGSGLPPSLPKAPVHPCPPPVAWARPLAPVPCRRLGPLSPHQSHGPTGCRRQLTVHCPAAAFAALALASAACCSMTLAVGRSSAQLCSVARTWPKEGRAVGCSAQQLVMRALTAGSRSVGSGMRWPWKPTVPTTCAGETG